MQKETVVTMRMILPGLPGRRVLSGTKDSRWILNG